MRFFIYGGCVSRDTYETVKDNHNLVGYIARQSLISAATKPEIRIPLEGLANKFNPRMVAGDIKSSLFPSIRAKAQQTDIFLFDILSERLGVYRLDGGKYVTNSVELAQSGLLKNFPYAKALIHFGTDRHFELWKSSVVSLKNLLMTVDLFQSAYFIKTIWTDRTRDGMVVPKFRNWDAEDANELYERYFAFLDELGFKPILPDSAISFSDADHKWGSSPYHYQPEYYNAVLESLFKQVESSS